MIIRAASADDADAIAALHAASWKDAYASILDPAYLSGPIDEDRLSFWRDRFRTPCEARCVIVADDNASLLGFVCVIDGKDEDWGALVDNLHAAPTARGKGTGAILLKSAARWVEQRDPASGLHLYVYEANLRARQFYARHGAQPAGRLISETPNARGAPILRVHWPLARDVI